MKTDFDHNLATGEVTLHLTMSTTQWKQALDWMASMTDGVGVFAEVLVGQEKDIMDNLRKLTQ